jgi:ABC-type antimicrobial peptide transport system permease subunit
MGIPLVAGRTFEESDSAQSQPVALVSQSFVTTYLDGREPLGQTFQFSLAGKLTIVGVVGDVRFRGLERSYEPQVYLPYQQQGDNRTMGYTPKDLVVRVRADDVGDAALTTLPGAIRRIVANVDPEQPVSDVRLLETLLAGETAARKVQVRVLAGFAAVACLLAGVGLHGLLTFVVARRTREFGVRLALGATPSQILGLVARRGLILGGLGVATGIWIAYAAGRSIEALLAGLSAADPLTLAGAGAVSLVVTLAGSLLPAIRTSRISPKQAIEQE